MKTAVERANVDVVIEGNKIVSVAAHSDAAHAGGQVVDGSQLTVMPGLTEFHSHLQPDFGPWPAARDYSRAYLHHLVKSGETLGAMLLSEINIAYYQSLMHGIRDAVSEGSFASFREATRAGWARGDIASR